MVNSVGTGAFAATCTIYFVHVVGLSIHQVGAGLALAGCTGVLAGIPAGRLADRVGAKPILVGLTLVQGSAIAGYAMITSWPQFVIAATAAVGAERAMAGVRNAFIGSVVVGTDRVGVRAYLRSVTTAGSAIGAGAATFVLLIDIPAAFRIVLGVDAATCYLCALLVLRIPSALASSARRACRRVGRQLPDRRFLVMAAAQAVLSLHTAVLTIAVPLWIVARTEQPRATIAMMLAANTAGAIDLPRPGTCHISSSHPVHEGGIDDLGGISLTAMVQVGSDAGLLEHVMQLAPGRRGVARVDDAAADLIQLREVPAAINRVRFDHKLVCPIPTSCEQSA
jgi:MFS family permease